MFDLIIRKLDEIRTEQAHARAHFDMRLDRSHERQNAMAIDTSKLVAAVDQIKADQAKNSTDIQAIIARLGTISTDDPAVQAAIDQAVTDLTTVDGNMQSSNTAAEAAVA